MGVAHNFVSAKADGGDATLVRPSDWNADHKITSFTFNGTNAVLTVTPSTNQDDYAPTNLASASILRLNIGGTMKLTGLTGGADGRMLSLLNASTDYLLWLEHENTSSTAANRFTLPDGFPVFLMPGDHLTLLYDGTASRWRVWMWSARGDGMGLTLFEDFSSVMNATAASVTSVGKVSLNATGTAATGQQVAYLVNTTEKPLGTYEIDTGTTATGRIVIGSVGNDFVSSQACALAVGRVALSDVAADGTNTYSVIVGFGDLGNVAAASQNGVFWEYRFNGAATEWSQARYSAGTRSGTTTGSPTPDANYIWLLVFLNAVWTRADFLYSTDSLTFTLASSPTTGFPAANTIMGWIGHGMFKSAGTGSRKSAVDFVGYRSSYARG